jgi:hypothetical protein
MTLRIRKKLRRALWLPSLFWFCWRDWSVIFWWVANPEATGC